MGVPPLLNLPAPSGDDRAASALRRTGFHVASELVEATVVLHLHGELDMATTPVLDQALTSALSKGATDLVVDLSCLSFIDSTGISMLLSAVQRSDQAGKAFRVRSPNRPVRKALHLTGVDRILSIEHAEPRSI